MQNWNKNTENKSNKQPREAEENASEKSVCDDLCEFFVWFLCG